MAILMQLILNMKRCLRSAGVRSSITFLTLSLSVVMTQSASQADGEYLTEPKHFLQHVFSGSSPEPGMIWLTGDIKDAAASILGHEPEFMRLRYWGDSNKSAWIVDEIGKTEPITIGVVVTGDVIEEIKVLAFRESRGWEIKHDFFTEQFVGVSLTEEADLTHSIDGISGATLSVRAMRNVSRLILYLSQSLTG
jgi:hypothetical protein